jgi:hypothetical protein
VQKIDDNFTAKYFHINGKKISFADQNPKIDKKPQEK